MASRAVTCAVVALALAGCSSGGSGSTAATPPPSATGPSRPGGLIGVIDAARLTAVCTNARQAETVADGGVQSAANESLSAAATLLERPPVDPAAARAAVAIRAEVRAGHPDRAIATALAFCHAHGVG